MATGVIVYGTFLATAHGQSGETDCVPMIHVTDLFRPHDDPDDHWDLACVYALAYQGCVDERGILIDYPKPQRRNDPEILAVAQLNHLTGFIESLHLDDKQVRICREATPACQASKQVVDLLTRSVSEGQTESLAHASGYDSHR